MVIKCIGEEFEMIDEKFDDDLRNICDIRRLDRVRNSLIRERCGWELSVLERMERNLLKWFWACGKNEGGKIG